MAGVTYDHVTKQFVEVKAVNDLSLDIKDKEFPVLVGPSGCGKTTAVLAENVIRAKLNFFGWPDSTPGRHYRLCGVPPRTRSLSLADRCASHRLNPFWITPNATPYTIPWRF